MHYVIKKISGDVDENGNMERASGEGIHRSSGYFLKDIPLKPRLTLYIPIFDCLSFLFFHHIFPKPPPPLTPERERERKERLFYIILT
jgi:hypothetical protein